MKIVISGEEVEIARGRCSELTPIRCDFLCVDADIGRFKNFEQQLVSASVAAHPKPEDQIKVR